MTRWLAATAWAGSWYLMFLEISRWHHVKPSLAFNPGSPAPNGMRPHPGPPLIMLYAVAAAAPLVVLSGLAGRLRRKRTLELGRPAGG